MKLFLFSLFSFAFSVSLYSYTPIIEPYHRIGELFLEFQEELQNEYPSHTFETTYLGKKREQLGIVAKYDFFGEEFDLPSARKLYLKIVQSLLKKINSDSAPRPYLHKYPETFDFVKLRLELYDTLAEHSKDKIAYIFFTNNHIHYYSYDKKENIYTLVCKETFTEAIERNL